MKEQTGTENKGGKGPFSRLKKRAIDFYERYTSGLQAGDFRKLFTEETKGLYRHFDKTFEEHDEKKEGRLKRTFSTGGRIFWGFILALSPARRFIYGIAFLVFIVSAFIIITAPANSDIRADAATVSMYTFIMVSFLLALELADKLSAKGELELAQELQNSLLPKDRQKFPGLSISRFALTATEVGGDYHDMKFTHGKSCVAIGDVSGHGLASGVVMAMAKSAWNTQLENGAEPSAILSSVESIIRLAGNTRTLMTMLHCQFDLDENKVEIANAGHIYPLFYSKRLDRVEWIETPPAYPLGVKQQGKFEVLQFSVEPGDLLVLVSDGFIESRNEEGECFDYGRLKNAVETTERKAPDSVAEHVIQRIRDFVGSAQQDDDLTMVIIGYKLNQG